MKRCIFDKFIIMALFLLPFGLFAQQNNVPAEASSYTSDNKFALVMGNGAYSSLTPLANPVNDAEDMAAALELIGFSVEKVLNGSLEQMENAVLRLKGRLGTARNSYGFLFYAGHGIQSGGENYLIPVDANIPSESFLRNRSVALQSMLDELNDAANILNVVVLDACRDNPFGWGRSTSRGLAVVNHQPVGSIIVYATSASQQASDGRGRNGLFTSRLLSNLLTPGLEVGEVFRRTGADVSKTSDLMQVPAIYNQFFGTAYLGDPPPGYDPSAAYVPGSARPTPLPQPSPANNGRDAKRDARLWTVGASVGSAMADPRLVATVRGTVAPISHLFIEPGIDVGILSGDRETGYFHVYPYVHAAYYYPFGRSGIYAGAGGGYLIGRYNFPEGK